MSTLLIPRSAGCLAELCSDDASQQVLQGVRIEDRGPEGVRLSASNARYLGVLTLPPGTRGDAKDFPSIPAFDAAPNSGTLAVVPSGAWKAAFKGVPHAKRTPPILQHIAVRIQPGQEVGLDAAKTTLPSTVTTCATDGENVSVQGPIRTLDGTFPDCDAVIPPADCPGITMVLSCELLGTLIKVASQFAGDRIGAVRITVPYAGLAKKTKNPSETYEHDVQRRVIGAIRVENLVSARTQNGTFTAVIIPLTID